MVWHIATHTHTLRWFFFPFMHAILVCTVSIHNGCNHHTHTQTTAMSIYLLILRLLQNIYRFLGHMLARDSSTKACQTVKAASTYLPSPPLAPQRVYKSMQCICIHEHTSHFAPSINRIGIFSSRKFTSFFFHTYIPILSIMVFLSDKVLCCLHHCMMHLQFL